MTHLYINGLGMVSPRGNALDALFMEAEGTPSAWLKCAHPEYAGFIEPANIRRMGRLIKMAMVAAKKCLADSQVAVPDAIITGTGLGCMEDTEKFLKTIISEEGSMASPTAFIHSTHNTISSQIAIALKCQGYNSTYVHRAFSFESAVLDAMLQLHEALPGRGRNILVGGVDEMSPSVYQIMRKLNFWKKEPEVNSLPDSHTPGTIAGEGMTYCLLSNQPSARSYARLMGLRQVYKPSGFSEIQTILTNFLETHKLTLSDIDLVMLGNNGDARFDHDYYSLAGLFPASTTLACFKHLCGEYFSASAFGLSLSALAIHRNEIPGSAVMRLGERKIFRKVLLYNQFRGIGHSFYLLSDVSV